MSTSEREVRGPVPGTHVVQLYDETNSLLAVVATYLRDGWRRGDNLLIVARPFHWALISSELSAIGCPVTELVAEGRIVALDAATTLATLLVDGRIVRESLDERLYPLVARLTKDAGTGLTAYGEMVDILASQGNFVAASELEAGWNEVLQRTPFRMMCGYSSATFGDPHTAGHLHAICHAHADAWARPTDLLATWLLSNRRSTYHLAPH